MEPRTGAELIAGYKAAHGRINGAGIEYQTRGSKERMLRDEVERLLCLNEDLHQRVRDQQRTIQKQDEMLVSFGLSIYDKRLNRKPTIAEIIKVAAIRSRLSEAEIKGPRRQVNYCYWRNIIVWIALKHIGCSTIVVGRALNRDHTTILNCRDKAIKYAKPEDIAAVEGSLGLGAVDHA